ncbi:MAG: hypothetical protein LBC84_04375, partial [Prevotellaceae bacterium]|nr:hypothetical protein [Prevotellaceae bacterium]
APIGATLTLTVTCPIPWTLKDLPPWLDVSDDHGTGSLTISFTVNETNDNEEPRTATLTFLATNGQKVQVNVTQETLCILIWTIADLADLATRVNAGTEPDGLYYKLMADLDLNFAPWNSGDGWIPIGDYNGFNTTISFKGNFDGNNHTISHLFINRSGTDYMGLFGCVYGGTIKNLGVEEVDIIGNDCVGGIAGLIIEATISNSYATGTISGNNYVGGVTGELDFSASNVISCYSTATVSGNNYVGGLVGLVFAGSVANCYATGAVGGNNYVGGVVGQVNTGVVSNNVVLNPDIKKTGTGTYFGRVAGLDIGTLTHNVAYDGMTATGFTFSGTNIDGDDIDIDAATMQITYTGMGWGFGSSETSPWKMGVGAYELPVFWWQTTTPASMPAHLANILISTPAQLAALATQVNGGDNKAGIRYKLTADIDAGSLWIPIGDNHTRTDATCFAGTFNGNGHTVTINGFGTVNPESGGYYNVGLFGYLGAGAVVQNLKVAGSLSFTTAGRCYVGGIAGRNNGGTIRNCVGAAGIVLTTTGLESSAGGIAGSNRITTGTIIDNCYSVANVSVSCTTGVCSAGGIAGTNNSTLTNCYATGQIESAASSAGGEAYVGGITGYNGGNTANCVALNAVVAMGLGNAGTPYIGRVVGRFMSGTLSNNRAIAISGLPDGTLTDINGLLITPAGANESESWWSTAAPTGPGWPFGTTNAAPWVWSATLLRTVLFWE